MLEVLDLVSRLSVELYSDDPDLAAFRDDLRRLEVKHGG